MLDQDQLDFFHQNGYLIMRQLVQGSELEILQKAADLVQLMGVARVGPDHRYTKGEDGTDVYWRSERLWDRSDIFQVVTVHPDLLENVGQCIGEPFLPMNDSLVVKLPYAGSRVRWHQDPPYGDPGRGLTLPVPNFTTDIYLDHSGPENGCVYAIPGHHLVGHVDLSTKEQEAFFQESGAIPLEMEAGDVLFHCLSSPHGSRPNHSYKQRRIFYLHYVTTEVYDDAYAQWEKWDTTQDDKVRAMIQKRQDFGYGNPLDRPDLRLTEHGFEFVGTPRTSPRYWTELQEQMPKNEIEAKKRLSFTEREPSFGPL